VDKQTPTTSTLGVLESAGLIRVASVQPELEYLFRHTLIKDAAYASLVRRDRRRLHRLVAETLEKLYLSEEVWAAAGPRPARSHVLSLLAHHLFQAGELARAALYFTQAGDAAAKVYANEEAIADYSRAIDLLRTQPSEHERLAHLYTRRGRAQEVTGHQLAALQSYLELEALGRERRLPRLELDGLARRAALLAIPSVLADAPQALELAQHALHMARGLGDQAAEARVLWTLMLAETFVSQPGRAIVYGQQALALARALDLRDLTALILNDLGRAHLAIGNVPAARAAGEEARRLWQAEGNLQMLAETVSTLANSYFFSGNYQAAQALLQESQTLARDTGDAWGQAYSLMLQTFINLEQGRVDEAFASADECLRLSVQAGFFYPQITVPAIKALVYSLLGDPARGLALAQPALALAESRAPELRSEVWAVLAKIHGDLGDWAQAEAHLQETHASARAEDMLTFAPLIAAEVEVRLALARRAPERAVALARAAAEKLASSGLKAFLARGLLPGARALRQLGREPEAETLLRQAQDLVEQQPSCWVQWEILAERASLAEQRGETEAARALRAEARLALDFIAAHLPDARLRASFLRLPEVRTVLASQGPIE
jgi:tetratricopeptide (TPR) repeat protein